MGPGDRACSRSSAGSIPKSELGADVTRKLAVAYARGARPGEAAAEFERIAANPAEDRKRAARGAAAVGGPVLQGQQHAQGGRRCSRSSSPPIRPRSRMRKRRAQRLADYAAKTGDVAKRGLLVSRDHQGRCAGGRAAHRAHALPGRQGATRAGAAGARCVPRRAADRASEEEPGREAQGAGRRRWTVTRRPPNTRSRR